MGALLASDFVRQELPRDLYRQDEKAGSGL
jgi:hypothetical protein